MPQPAQKILLWPFDGKVETILTALKREPINAILRDKDPYRQLRYIVDYLKLPELDAQSFVCESHYIDRDYMEDHGVFYSRSLRGYPNYCQRLHFFSLAKGKLYEELKSATGSGSVSDSAVSQLSTSYLGFAVIKPVPGAPIGRTVLKHLPRDKDDGHLRSFRCVRDYRIHILGMTLRVSGLAFQQQDGGVSACATTAIWSSLQKIREFEDVRIATPAEITTLASQHALPFGRAMPSEGLSTGQMCEAIQALGLAPNLYRPDAAEDVLAYVHAAERSGFPCILIWEEGPIGARHAVTVVGVKTFPASMPPADGFEERAAEVRALYVHDDRLGPYIRADVEREGKLRFNIPYPDSSPPETWHATHVIVPVHPKIRLSFASLLRISRRFAVAVRHALEQPHSSLRFESYFMLGHKYIDDLCRNASQPALRKLGVQLAAECALPRYVGAVHVEVGGLGWLDLLLDSTSTLRSIECAAIICHGEASATLAKTAAELGGQYGCRAFFSGSVAS